MYGLAILMGVEIDMMAKKYLKTKLGKVVFGWFFAILMILGAVTPICQSGEVAAIGNEATNAMVSSEDAIVLAVNDGDVESGGVEGEDDARGVGENNCKKGMGAVGWIICPITEKLSEAVDWLYGWLEKILVLNPIVMEDGSPVYEIWKYCLMITNMVFIVFLMVVIYSQITGFGISNYGIKKALPKLIVTAVFVNLSFLICSLAVDLSNAIGNGLTGVFTTVREGASGTSAAGVTLGQAFRAVAGGGAIAIGAGVIAFESGALWLLIPIVLGAIVSVVTGLFVLALRHAVVVLLVMVSPLAFVACIFPNTDGWFKKWKQLFIKMMTFYPLFAVLFGASNVAGFAIMASAQSWFGVLLGIAVQIFPLFFAVSLMKMSGTFLGGIYARTRGLASRPLARNRAWAESHSQLAKQKRLSSGRALTPSMKLMGFISNRRIARDEDLNEYAKMVKNRGLAYNVQRKYKKNGVPNKDGEHDYAMQAKNMGYEAIIERHKNNMNKGLGQLSVVSANASKAQKARLDKLDVKNVKAADALFAEKARGETIEYGNAAGRHKRFDDAINAHFDEENRYLRDENGSYILDENGNRVLNTKYRMHKIADRDGAEARYKSIRDIMEGEVVDAQYAAASAAYGYDSQRKIIEARYQKYFEMAPPTKDNVYRLNEITLRPDAPELIDAIIPGLRVLNQRGDTDLVRKQLENVLNSQSGVMLGSHASQALASFLMFEVKDNDPFLRRFGKYINLETAQVYNSNKRQNERLSLNEYITGEYDDWEPGQPNVARRGRSKRSMMTLLEGTSLDNVERTAYANLDEMLMNTYTRNGRLDEAKYFAKREEIENAIGPAFISASLKYPSGSEQLKNAVSFLTGYGADGKARWDDGGDLEGSTMAQEYFRKKTLKYMKDQTPAQILGMRSDYRDAVVGHLLDAYLDENPDEKRRYELAKSEIQGRYGDEDAETAQKKRSADLKKLNMENAGKQMRKILGESGKLEQIYRTRRSGAANNAKDWLREMVSLDNDDVLRREVDYYNQRRRNNEPARRGTDSNAESGDAGRIYSETDRSDYLATMSDLNDRYGDEDKQEYFDRMRAQLEEWFGGDDYLIHEYDRYYRDHSSIDNDELYTWIKDMLEDLDNYPGNRDQNR